MSYLAYLSEKGVSQGHRVNVETSLRLLQKGFEERSKRFENNSVALVRFCPERRQETSLNEGEEKRVAIVTFF